VSAHRPRPSRRKSPRRSLSARGQLIHTFAGLGFCLVFSLLALGSFIIEEEFRDPVAANPVGLLFAAVLIATAIILLYSFLHPSKNLGARTDAPAHRMPSEPRTLAVARTTTGMRIGNPGSLPLHARYVDHARVVIQR
jgi:hypothetical protein